MTVKIDRQLSATLRSPRTLRRRLGRALARKTQRMLRQLAGLEDSRGIYGIPGARAHRLHGNLEGKIAIDLGHPFRMLLQVNQLEILVVDITDYH